MSTKQIQSLRNAAAYLKGKSGQLTRGEQELWAELTKPEAILELLDGIDAELAAANSQQAA